MKYRGGSNIASIPNFLSDLREIQEEHVTVTKRGLRVVMPREFLECKTDVFNRYCYHSSELIRQTLPCS